MGQWQTGLLDIYEFKTDWVCGYRRVIKEAANIFNIPSILLAGIAHMEVGGASYSEDNVIHLIRSFLRGSSAADRTTFGALSLNVALAAELLGYDFTNLSKAQRRWIIESLQDTKINVFLAALNLSDLKNYYFPNKNELSLEDMMTIAGAYNRGKIPKDQLWEYGYAGGYGREAVQNRVNDYQLDGVLNGNC